MMRGFLRTVQYARSWKGGADVREIETVFARDGETIPATLVLPAERTGPLPGWIALGGMSRMGRKHPQLVRFTRALASTGVAVFVPEVPEWRELEMTPAVTTPTIRGCLDVLDERDEVLPGKVALIGFSFGAPRVALASTCPELSGRIAGAVLFGSYCSLDRTLDCMFTGCHEWEGKEYTLEPDPYGRWVVGSNHLTGIPGLEDAEDVAAALRRLAVAASGQRISAWDPRHDAMIGELRRGLPPGRRPVLDLFATPSDEERPGREALSEMAGLLAQASRRAEPLLDFDEDLDRLGVPTQLIHGRGDRLIPFTEGLRLQERIPDDALKTLTVTGLFSHSADRSAGSPLQKARESMTFFETMRGLINTV